MSNRHAALGYLGRRLADRGFIAARDIYGAVAVYAVAPDDAAVLEGWLFDQFPEARPRRESRRSVLTDR